MASGEIALEEVRIRYSDHGVTKVNSSTIV
jgi:hypothetical protein